jgi:hypothetical protein
MRNITTPNLECLIPTVKHRGGSVTVWAAASWYSVSPLTNNLHDQITARQNVDRMSNYVHTTIHNFLNNDAVF